MKIKDHINLGKHLLNSINHKMSVMERKLFLFGCIEPDLNPLTRLCETSKNEYFCGHNAEYIKNNINQYIDKIEINSNFSVYHYFILGTIIHYLADSFTFAHNDSFTGSIKEHREYEKELHVNFKYILRQYSSSKRSHPKNSMTTFFHASHNEYISLPQSIETDIEYIINVCETSFQSLIKQPSYNLASQKQVPALE